jgi:hypothetical protein
MQSTWQPRAACGGVLPAVACNKGISQGVLVLCWAPCEAAPAAKMFVQPKSRMMLRTPDAKVPPSTKTCQHMMMQVIPRVAVAENLAPREQACLIRATSQKGLCIPVCPAAGGWYGADAPSFI